MRRGLVLVVVVVGLLGTFFTVPFAASAAPAVAPTPPHVRGDRTVPAYSYADAVHESVHVEAPFDSDGDGAPDRIAADIVRPSTPDGVRVPVIMDASPYYQCCGRGNESELKTYFGDGTIAKMPLFYDNYFVPRGYAMVQVDLAGTSRSTGCPDVGGRNEVLGAKAVVDWLNGRARGFDSSGRRVSAGWTTGKVGMIGKSWDGTIANGVAATGVRGLETIVPISAISSWYGYMRFGGVLRSEGYVDYLAHLVDGRGGRTCDDSIAADQAASDDSTGDYNAFWAERNYRPDASRVRASVFVVHGLNDLNVTTDQFGQWWQELAANGVSRKIWLSQDGHVDPFDYRRSVWVRTLHQWFDHWLQGLDNGVTGQPQATVQRADGRWTTQSVWPAARTRDVVVPLATLGGGAERTFTDRPNLTESVATARPEAAISGRAVFLSGELPRSLAVAGTPTVTLRVEVDRPTTELTTKLVDYGSQRRVDYLSGEGVRTLTTQSCWGQTSTVDDPCYYDLAQNYTTTDVDVLSRGWLDAAHHESLSRTTPLTPGRWYTITVPIDTTDFHVAPGHRLGLVVTQSDLENTAPASTGATLSLDPTASSLTLPVTGGYRIPAGPALPPGAGDPTSSSSRAPAAPPRAVHRVVPEG